MKKRKKKLLSRANTISLISVVMLLILLFVAIKIGSKNLYEKDAYYASREQALQEAIEAESSREEALEDYKTYIRSKEFIERMAKEHFGLIYKDEIILKPSQ